MNNVEKVSIDVDEINRLVMELASFGAYANTGVWRVVYSPEWIAANDFIRRYCDGAGLTTRMDAVGNLWARVEGSDGGDTIVTGSHVDTQCPGGRYDGTLGIIAGIVAVKSLLSQFGAPKRPMEVVSFAEEESSRFANAQFWGSRGVVGQITSDDLIMVRDATGVPIGEAMSAIGLDPLDVASVAREDIGSFLELHIEQGPILEDADYAVGVVTGVTGIRHLNVTIFGEGNHAGAFPMDLRKDPMAAFAEIATTLIDHAKRAGRPMVTTIGRIAAEPNGVSTIPSLVRFDIDARHPIQSEFEEMDRFHRKTIQNVCERHGLMYEIALDLEHAACPSDPGLLETIRKAARRQDVPFMELHSGAGHDAQQMGGICPVAMIFVRSKDGRSHVPEEFSSIQDIAKGVRVLAQALYELAYA